MNRPHEYLHVVVPASALLTMPSRGYSARMTTGTGIFFSNSALISGESNMVVITMFEAWVIDPQGRRGSQFNRELWFNPRICVPLNKLCTKNGGVYIPLARACSLEMW